MFRSRIACAVLVTAQFSFVEAAHAAEQWALAITNPGPTSGAAGGPLEAVANVHTGELYLKYGVSAGGQTARGRWRAMRYGGFPGDFTGVWDTTEPADGFPNTAILEIDPAPGIPGVDIDVYSLLWPNGDTGWLIGQHPYAVGAWQAGAVGSINMPGDGTAGIALFVENGSGGLMLA
jgi:hypothetical protein